MATLTLNNGKAPVIGKELFAETFEMGLGNQIRVGLVSPSSDGMLYPSNSSASDQYYCADGSYRSQPDSIFGFSQKHLFPAPKAQLYSTSTTVSVSTLVGVNTGYIKEYSYGSDVKVLGKNLTMTLPTAMAADMSKAMIGKIVNFRYFGAWFGFLTIKQAAGNLDGGETPSMVFNKTSAAELGGFSFMWSGTSWFRVLF